MDGNTHAVAAGMPGTGLEELVDGIVGPGGPKARRSLDDWAARARLGPDWLATVTWATTHRHSVLHGITLEEVEAATKWSPREREDRHALGVRSAAETRIGAVEDWQGPPFAFNYVFHEILERNGRIPWWPEVRRFLRSGDAQPWLLGPFTNRFSRFWNTPADRDRYLDALRFRVGCSYYSWLREVDLFTRLRVEHGLPVRYHVLADAVFKTDLWCGNLLVSVLIRNRKMRDGAAGRKHRAEQVLDPSAFRLLAAEVDAPRRFGLPELVSRESVAELAFAARSACGGLPRPVRPFLGRRAWSRLPDWTVGAPR